MEKRYFEKIGREISLLGFGCMRLPKNAEGKIDFKEAEELIDTAYKAGVNYFDTAYPYHDGESELFIGKALSKYPRESFCLATKMPTWETASSIERVEEIFNEQLEKCGVDYFDFYLLHAMDKNRLKRVIDLGMYDFFKKKKEEGKIRRLGFSFHDSPDVFEKIITGFEWDFAQIQMNYLDWTMIDSRQLYETAKANGVPLVIMEPVRGGALAQLNEKACAILKEACPENSIASWAIRFAASPDNVMCVLSGMSNREQVEDNLKTMTNFKPLTDEERKVINRAVEAYQSAAVVPCTACRYCMDCPAGVNIPSVFAVYNRYKTTENAKEFKNNYATLGESRQADKCVKCGMCMKHCPQGINIPERMEEIKNFAANLTV